MLEEYEIQAIKTLLIEKGVMTEEEIKRKHDELLRAKRDSDKRYYKELYL